ncbi:MAG: helix-turn-helix transcriptional regulator, partial [Clostridia bacterium]
MYLEVRLREIRQAKNLTVRGLAEQAKIGAATISQIENGKELPRIDTALMLCAALGCTASDVFVLHESDGDRLP